MKFFFDSIIAISGKFAGAFLGLLAGIILARALGPEKLGQYQIFLSSQTIIITLFSLGVGNASIYFINSGRFLKSEIISSFFLLFIPLGVIVSVLFGFLIFGFDGYFGEVKLVPLIFFLAGTGALIISSVLRPVLYAEQKIKKVVWISILPPLTLLFGLSILFLSKKIKVETALLLWGVGNILASADLLNYYIKDFDINLKLKNNQVLRVIFYGIKLSASNLMFVVNSNVVIFLIKHFQKSGFESVGIYSRAAAICSLTYMVPISLGPLLYSKWTGLDTNKLKNLVEKTSRILILFSFSIAILLIVFRKLIILLFYGKEFFSAQETILILAPTLVFYSITEVFNNLFASIGKAQITLFVFIGAFFVIITAGIIFIPNFGINGAALSVFFGSIFNAVVMFWFAKKHAKINPVKSFLISQKDLSFFTSLFKKQA